MNILFSFLTRNGIDSTSALMTIAHLGAKNIDILYDNELNSNFTESLCYCEEVLGCNINLIDCQGEDIAKKRNRSLEHTNSRHIVFMDDDSVPNSTAMTYAINYQGYYPYVNFSRVFFKLDRSDWTDSNSKDETIEPWWRICGKDYYVYTATTGFLAVDTFYFKEIGGFQYHPDADMPFLSDLWTTFLVSKKFNKPGLLYHRGLVYNINRSEHQLNEKIENWRMKFQEVIYQEIKNTFGKVFERLE